MESFSEYLPLGKHLGQHLGPRSYLFLLLEPGNQRVTPKPGCRTWSEGPEFQIRKGKKIKKKKESGLPRVTQQGRATLETCYSKCGQWTSSAGIPWEWVRSGEPQAPSRPAEFKSSVSQDPQVTGMHISLRNPDLEEVNKAEISKDFSFSFLFSVVVFKPGDYPGLKTW